MVPEDMSHNEDHSMSSSLFDDQPPPSSCSSKGSYDNKADFHNETSEILKNQYSPRSDTKEKWKRLESFNKKIDRLEILRTIISISLLVLGFVSICILWIPVKVFGLTFYSIILVSHSSLFLCLAIVEKQIYPPLIDGRYILSCEIEEQTSHLPSHHSSRNELIWCYLGISLSVLTNAAIWKYLSYLNVPDIMEDTEEAGKVMIICAFLGITLLFAFFFAPSCLGPLYGEPEIKKNETEQDKENTEKNVKFQIYDASRLEGELVTQKIREIKELKNEMVEKDGSYSKLLQVKDKEIARLRKENMEGNNKTNGYSPKKKASKKSNKSAGKNY
ncbi:hypothetical protein MOSE0_C00276 [Monosporozyma servazzii]